MGIGSPQEFPVGSFGGASADEPQSDAPVLVTNLATLLDQFTQNVTYSEAHTVGEFAATVGALHAELAMLARQFGAANEPEAIDFDDIFPDGAQLYKDFEGVAAEEELEHVCRELSR